MAELKKVLSYKILLLIIINSIMGTGIYFLPAIGAATAGSASLLSWIIMSVLAIYISMCFAELCSMFPSAGGVYEFCKHAYGRVISFAVGWLALIAGNITIAMLIIGGISYLLPAGIPEAKIVIMMLSAAFLLIFNIVAYRGMRSSAVMLITFSMITLATFISLIVASAFRLDPSNLDGIMSYPVSAVLLAVFFIAETFFGWESATFLAGETKNGKKIVPKALVHGTIIICLIALSFSFVSMGSVGPQAFGESQAPLSTVALFNFGETGKIFFMILVYLAIIGAVADWVVSSPRLILSMAKDKLFLPQFRKIHKRYNTPANAIIFQCCLSILFVFLGLGSYTTLLHLLVPLLLIMYSFVLIAVVVLRYKRPKQVRYFRVPFGKTGPIMIVAAFIFLLVLWANMTEGAASILLKGFSLIIFGIPVYFLLEMYYDPRAVRFIDDIFAYFTLLTERIALPLKIRKEIIHHLGNIKGKTLLEFGCSVGTLTMHLAEEVGPAGKIWATDISKREVHITERRAMKKGHNHVIVLHDSEHAYRIHPDVPKTHSVVSVGMLGYLQDKEAVLKGINKKLKVGSKICFVDYDKFFDIIPNAEWLRSDQRIRYVFREAGFHVDIIRKQGFAWKYIFIYGTKIREL